MDNAKISPVFFRYCVWEFFIEEGFIAQSIGYNDKLFMNALNKWTISLSPTLHLSITSLLSTFYRFAFFFSLPAVSFKSIPTIRPWRFEFFWTVENPLSSWTCIKFKALVWALSNKLFIFSSISFSCDIWVSLWCFLLLSKSLHTPFNFLTFLNKSIIFFTYSMTNLGFI